MENNITRCRCRCADPFCNMDDVGDAQQHHVHEFIGCVMIAEAGGRAHNHRFAGVSGPAVSALISHVHRIATRTDFYRNHYHAVIRESGPAVPVGDGMRHVHHLEGNTTVNEDHQHAFQVAFLLDDPVGK